MKQTVRSLLFAAAAFVAMNTAAPVYATPVPNPADFVITELPGQYFVYNNSTDWWIYAFAASNPAAALPGAAATTDFTNWAGFTASLDLGGPTAVPVFAYASADADLTNLNSPFLTTVLLTDYIAPGTSSDKFHFTGLPASDFGILLVDANGGLGQTNSVSATPLPAALPLFAGGLGLVGLLARRRKRKNAAALAAV
jgi:hypothetical protein